MTMGGPAGELAQWWGPHSEAGWVGGPPCLGRAPRAHSQRAPPACLSHNSPLSPSPLSLCPLCISLSLFVSLAICLSLSIPTSLSPSPSYVSPCVLSHISPCFLALLEPSPLPLSSHQLWSLQVSLLDSCEEPPVGGGLATTSLNADAGSRSGPQGPELHGHPCPSQSKVCRRQVVCARLGPCPL